MRPVAEHPSTDDALIDLLAHPLDHAHTRVAIRQRVRPRRVLASNEESALTIVSECPLWSSAPVHIHLRALTDSGKGRAYQHVSTARKRDLHLPHRGMVRLCKVNLLGAWHGLSLTSHLPRTNGDESMIRPVATRWLQSSSSSSWRGDRAPRRQARCAPGLCLPPSYATGHAHSAQRS